MEDLEENCNNYNIFPQVWNKRVKRLQKYGLVGGRGSGVRFRPSAVTCQGPPRGPAIVFYVSTNLTALWLGICAIWCTNEVFGGGKWRGAPLRR